MKLKEVNSNEIIEEAEFEVISNEDNNQDSGIKVELSSPEEEVEIQPEELTSEDNKENSIIRTQYAFAEKQIDIVNINKIKKNIEELNVSNVIFISVLSVASGVLPFAVDRIRNKKGFKKFTRNEVIDTILVLLPMITSIGQKTTDGTMFGKMFGGLHKVSKFMSLSPAIRELILNIKNNGGKFNSEDWNVYLKSVPFIFNAFIIPTIANPAILKQGLFFIKAIFGKKISDAINKKTNGFLKDWGIETEDIFDTAIGSIDTLSEELNKRGIIDKEATDEVTEKLASKGLSIASSLVLNKKTKGKSGNRFGANSINARAGGMF